MWWQTILRHHPTVHLKKSRKKKKTSVDSLPRSKPHSSQIQAQTIITTTTYLVACLAHAIWWTYCEKTLQQKCTSEGWVFLLAFQTFWIVRLVNFRTWNFLSAVNASLLFSVTNSMTNSLICLDFCFLKVAATFDPLPAVSADAHLLPSWFMPLYKNQTHNTKLYIQNLHTWEQ